MPQAEHQDCLPRLDIQNLALDSGGKALLSFFVLGAVTEEAMTNAVEVMAVLLTYIPSAMQDHFDDGGFTSYDATQLRILAPGQFAGIELTIYHDGEVPRNSLWRKIGDGLKFEIDEDDLRDCFMGKITLFGGAVTNLHAGSSNA
jgi:hypothetical protein